MMTSRAAVPVVSIEAENGATSSNVSTVNYEAASSAKAVKFRDVNQLSAKGFGMSVPRLPIQTPTAQQQWLADMKAMGVT